MDQGSAATHVAAMLFAAFAAVAIAFQVALTFGAPWGEFTLGGKYRGRLPGAVRIVPALSSAVLCGFVIIVLAREDLAFAGMAPAARWMIWFVVAYCALGAIANFITPSRRERMVWFPVLLLLLASSTVVGLRH